VKCMCESMIMKVHEYFHLVKKMNSAFSLWRYSLKDLGGSLCLELNWNLLLITNVMKQDFIFEKSRCCDEHWKNQCDFMINHMEWLVHNRSFKCIPYSKNRLKDLLCLWLFEIIFYVILHIFLQYKNLWLCKWV
jgi:hypothetical protein